MVNGAEDEPSQEVTAAVGSAYAAVIELAVAALDEPHDATPPVLAARIALQILLDRCSALQKDALEAARAVPAPTSGDAGA